MHTFAQALHHLDYLSEFQWQFGLERMYVWRQALAKPDQAYRSIIVGGTNGKGSTCAFLTSIFKHQGLTVGCYSSPHLQCPTERIAINQLAIDTVDFAQLTTELIDYQKKLGLPQLSYFEWLTIMAAQYFRQKQVEVAIFEVGLGGRLDATHALSHQAAIVTHIDLDHQNYLGSTVLEIAKEKLEIIPYDGFCVMAKASDDVVEHAVTKARHRKSQLYVEARDFSIDQTTLHIHSSWIHSNLEASSVELNYQLSGQHQAINAALAVLAAKVLTPISPTTIATALAEAKIPARCQQWHHPSKSTHILIDVAHNPNAFEALMTVLPQLWPLGDFAMILGMQATKAWQEVLMLVLNKVQRLYITKPNCPAAWPLDLVASFSQSWLRQKNLDSEINYHQNLDTAVEQALAHEQRVVVCGSFYVVGPAMQCLTQHGFSPLSKH